MNNVKYAIYERYAATERESSWTQVGPDYSDHDEALAEWERLDDLYGHNTYHRLVEVRVLREA